MMKWLHDSGSDKCWRACLRRTVRSPQTESSSSPSFVEEDWEGKELGRESISSHKQSGWSLLKILSPVTDICLDLCACNERDGSQVILLLCMIQTPPEDRFSK